MTISHSSEAPVITLDGPSGTGKGTLCHMLASHLKWQILDSGNIYRVLAYVLRKSNVDFSEINRMTNIAHDLDLRFEMTADLQSLVLLNNEEVYSELRTEVCGQDASKIAAIPEIREALLARQRAFLKPPGLVTDGRDMGTVVFPNAFLKIYLDASDEVRAKRRYFQLKEKGFDVTLAQVVDELSMRDARDSSRSCAPLRPAEDAVIVDTSNLNATEVFHEVLQLFHRSRGQSHCK